MFNALFQRKPFLSIIHYCSRIGLIALIGIMLLLCKRMLVPTQTLATVDVTGILRQFVHSQAKLNLPPKLLKLRATTFGHQLETTLNAIANEYHVVLILQEAVITGAVDLTPLVKERLNKEELPTSNKALW
jgi:Type-F conjugative transfer system protein (TrbI_Ftype)